MNAVHEKCTILNMNDAHECPMHAQAHALQSILQMFSQDHVHIRCHGCCMLLDVACFS